jgi:hypothetical protein
MDLAAEDKRRAPRVVAKLDAVLAIDGRVLSRCAILDINAYGAKVEVTQAPDADPLPDAFYLVDLLSSVAYKARVVWSQAPLCGTRFLETWSLSAPTSPQWLKDIRRDSLQLDARERGIRLVWSGGEPRQGSAA